MRVTWESVQRMCVVIGILFASLISAVSGAQQTNLTQEQAELAVARVTSIMKQPGIPITLPRDDCDAGRCASRTQQGTHDDRALMILSGLTEVGAQSIAPSSSEPVFFGGSAMRCRRFAANSLNCCTHDGWVNTVDAHRCDQQEAQLNVARQEGRAVSLGTRCKRRVLSNCVEHESVYCVFPTAMAALIQQQGRAMQLKIPFGDAHGGVATANCRGLRPEELAALDMRTLDFSSQIPAYQARAQTLSSPTLHSVTQRLHQVMPS